MGRIRPNITEFAFFLGGALVLVVGWVADLNGIFELGAQPLSHGSASTLPLRLFITVYGVAFATIGIWYENFPEILYDNETATRYIVALLFLGDGGLHLYAFNDHLGDPFSASFFAVFSSIQMAAAFLIPYGRRQLNEVWIGVTVFLILAYIVTRTMAVWPIGYVEEVDPLGVVSKIVELVTVVFLVSLVRSERAARRTAVRATPAAVR